MFRGGVLFYPLANFDTELQRISFTECAVVRKIRVELLEQKPRTEISPALRKEIWILEG